MNIIDPILLLLVALFALRGYFKGLFRESFSLLGLLVGFMSAVRYDEPLAVLLSEQWKLPLIVLKGGSFIGIFLLVYVVSSLTGWLLHCWSRALFLHTVNRVGGVVLGAGKGTAILALAILLLASVPVIPQAAKKKIDASYLAPPLYLLARQLIRVGKAALGHAEDEPERRAVRFA